MIYSFVPIADNGLPNIVQPVQDNPVTISDGQYTGFTLEILDQNFKQIDILDPTISIVLKFRIPREE